jgi:hypothetical protein
MFSILSLPPLYTLPESDAHEISYSDQPSHDLESGLVATVEHSEIMPSETPSSTTQRAPNGPNTIPPRTSSTNGTLHTPKHSIDGPIPEESVRHSYAGHGSAYIPKKAGGDHTGSDKRKSLPSGAPGSTVDGTITRSPAPVAAPAGATRHIGEELVYKSHPEWTDEKEKVRAANHFVL